MKRILREKSGTDETLQEETKEGHCQKDETEQKTDGKEVQRIINKWKKAQVPG
jgi:hypothetical protein